jgi:predicted transcriptional regulator
MNRENIWSDEVEINPILLLERGKVKTSKYKEIIVAILKAEYPQKLTKKELQLRAKIKRCRFIVLLKELLASGTVVRSQSGTRSDPYRYSLPDCDSTADA